MHSMVHYHGSCYHSTVARLQLESGESATILGMPIAPMSASMHLQARQRFDITFAVLGYASARGPVTNSITSVPCGSSTVSGTDRRRIRYFVGRKISTTIVINLLI